MRLCRCHAILSAAAAPSSLALIQGFAFFDALKLLRGRLLFRSQLRSVEAGFTTHTLQIVVADDQSTCCKSKNIVRSKNSHRVRRSIS